MSNVSVEPRIVELGRMLLAGLRYEGRNEHGEIPAMWEVFFTRLAELRERAISPAVFYGVERSIPGVPESERWEYLAAVEVSSIEGLPAGLDGWETPALTCAVLEAQGIEGIGPTSDAFYGEWLPHSAQYRAGESLMIERYPATFSDDQIIELCFPVAPKERAP